MRGTTIPASPGWRAAAAALLASLAPAAARADAASAPDAPEPGRYLLRLDPSFALAGAPQGLRLAALSSPSASSLRLALGADPTEPEYRRNFLVPSIEVPAFAVALNLVNRAMGHEWARVNFFENLWDHLVHGPWVYDTDPIDTNFAEHPYNGSVYFNMARSSGLDFYWSFAYAFAGSLVWELGGEAEPPSKNDQVMTSVGGAFIGEALYRSFVLIVNGGGESPGFWREAGAFLTSPAAGFNRLLFGNRYRSPVWDERPRVSYRFTAGGGVVRNHDPHGGTQDGGAAMAGFQVEYGHPADEAFRIRHPFDAFTLRFIYLWTGLSGSGGTTQVHGTIAGWRLDFGSFRGIWGIVGNYDFIDAGVYRVGSAAVGIGATGAFALSEGVSLGASFSLLGVLMGAAGATSQPVGGRDYHEGPGGQSNLDLRLAVGTAAMVELSGREFYVGSAAFPGWEDITYGTLAATVRLWGPHAVSLAAHTSRRTAHYPDVPDVKQNAGVLTLGYAWLSEPWFGGARRVSAAE